jgi:mannosyltransferase
MTVLEHRAPDVSAGGAGTDAGGRAPLTSWPLPVGVALVVSFVLSIVTLGRPSFSLDESLSATLAYSPWPTFSHSVLHREANMSLYYLLLRVWDAVASTLVGSGGSREAVVRSLSVVSSVGALAIVMVVTRRLFDRRTALICGVLLAVDPLVVLFAQDARGYALSLLLVCASSALFVRGIRAPSGWGLWVGYALVSALAAYANFWAALVPLAHAASLSFLPRRSAPWRYLVPTGVGLGILLVPLALLIHATDSSGVNWAAGSSAGKLFTTARADVPHGVIDLAVLLVVVVVVAAVAVVTRHSRTRGVADWLTGHWPVVFVVCWLVVPVAVVVLLSLAYKPLLVVRYLVICLPPFVMLVSYGLARLDRRGTLAVLGALVVVSGVGLGALFAHGSPQDWRGAVASVAHRSQPGDGLVIFAPYTRIPFQWYVPENPAAATNLHPLYPAGALGANAMRYDTSIGIRSSSIEQAVAGYHRVWVVLCQQQLNPGGERALVTGLRSAGLTPVRTEAFHGIEVVLYGARS